MKKSCSRSGEQKRRRTWTVRHAKDEVKPKDDTDTTKKVVKEKDK